MKITIFGTGYVGLVTGVCFAELGHEVSCIDIDGTKINLLNQGISPIYEPGLEELLQKNKKRLHFTTDSKPAIDSADLLFIAVGTPSKSNGAAELKYVFAVAEQIAKSVKEDKVVVIKSTVPVGTEADIEKIIKKHTSKEITLVSNPEFLREGTAIKDFMEPDRVVIGTDNQKAAELLFKLYEKLNATLVHTDIRSAQLIKYASNAFLATKISFINEMANLAEKFGANVNFIASGMGLDKRIGKEFLKAGVGYGGSCFPKDVKELLYTAKANKVDLAILQAVEKVNESQKMKALEKLKTVISLKGATVAIIGIAFKPNTDDIREAPSLNLIQELLKQNVEVKAWDPVAEENAKKVFPTVQYFPTMYETIEEADAVVIVTEWSEIKDLDLAKVKKLMKKPVIIDGRNTLDPKEAREKGFTYIGIGI